MFSSDKEYDSIITFIKHFSKVDGEYMTKNTTGKSVNQERIFRLIREQKELTKQEIAAHLNLSMPTVLHNIDTMMQSGLLTEAGTNESTGGRKAMKLTLNPAAGYSIGIDLALHHVEIVVTDLWGNILCQKTVPTRFEDKPDWYFGLERELTSLLMEHHIEIEKVLGCGISFPGIVDEQSGYLVKSHILNMDYINLDRFKKVLPFPIAVANDANCACVAEKSPEHSTYLYISLNESVGGALMLDGKLYVGNTFQAGEVGHMILQPNGKQCYCGKKGCADSYLSPMAFLKKNQSIEEFFQLAAAGDIKTNSLLNEYFEYLAVFISNLRMLLNIDIILGGTVGKYLDPYFDKLCKKTGDYDLFARDVDYIKPCKIRQSACAVGASIFAMERYSINLINR